MMNRFDLWSAWFVVLACAMPAVGQEVPAEKRPPMPEADTPRWPGAQPGGTVLLPNQWSLKPAGKQLKLGDFPIHMEVHPTEPYAAVLHAGHGDHEIVIVDVKSDKIVSRANIPQAFYGLCFSQDGKQVYCSGGEHEVVHRFDFAGGYLTGHQELQVVDPKEKFVVGGVVLTPDQKSVIACGTWGHAIRVLSLADPKTQKVVKLEKDSYPYTALPSKDGRRMYVSLWGAAAVAIVDAEKLEVAATWKVDEHPTEMILSADESLLYVACANSNHVHVIDTKSGATLEVISSSLHPKSPVGSTPNSIALSVDGNALLVANADNNTVAVVDVSKRGHSAALGLIPTAWYPTSVRFDAKLPRILITSGKGQSSLANPQGPNPLQALPATVQQYIGGLYRGTLGFVDLPNPAQLAAMTRTAMTNSPLAADQAPRTKGRDGDNPIPAKVGEKSPIKYCVYIIKENRTYDQVFGDMPEGNGDKNLCIFPEKVTPNHHALAREFVLLDNFYVESEVSADGHEWSMAAYATDFTEKSWPLSYRGNRVGGKIGYAAEGNFPISASAGGYIWDRAKEAGLDYRSYGEFIQNAAKVGEPGKAKVKGLEGHFDPLYRSYDLNYRDVDRAKRFIEELKQYEEKGTYPNLVILRLPNDHTSGTSLGARTPIAMVADNDLALGQVVEALSQSKFWKEMAIFVVEDDAQNGSDHVDAHRTVALAISPYIRRGKVDSNMYSTASMLRSMELILGMKPMTQFDAAALPMYGAFHGKLDAAPFKHRPAQVALDTLNTKLSWGHEESAKMNLAREDAADDLKLNEIVWKSVRGADSRMPPPVRASFVFPHQEEEEEEDDDD